MHSLCRLRPCTVSAKQAFLHSNNSPNLEYKEHKILFKVLNDRKRDSRYPKENSMHYISHPREEVQILMNKKWTLILNS